LGYQFDKNQTNFWEITFEFFANFILLLGALLSQQCHQAYFPLVFTKSDQDASRVIVVG